MVWAVAFALTGLFALGGVAVRAAGAAPHPSSSLSDQLFVIETAPGGLCSDALAQDTRALMKAHASVLKTRLQSARGADAVRIVNQLVFEDLGIGSSRDLHDPGNLCLGSVLKRRQGYCVGIAGLYLSLAEAAGLPIAAVGTPSHLFLRYDDGRTRINIETFRQGAEVLDADYVRDERIPQASIASGVFLRPLTSDEFLAQFYNNIGAIYSERRNFDAASKAYSRALDLDRRLPAAWYNWASDLLQSGDSRRATRLFTHSLELYPTDVWALNNRGVAYMKRGNEKKARRDFMQALQFDPGFETARKNLSDASEPPR